MSTAEHDAFGPWIDEVRTPSVVPPLYRDHPLDFAMLSGSVAERVVLSTPTVVSDWPGSRP